MVKSDVCDKVSVSMRIGRSYILISFILMGFIRLLYHGKCTFYILLALYHQYLDLTRLLWICLYLGEISTHSGA